MDAIMQQMDDILAWKRKLHSIGALFGWLIFVNFFQLWMVPFGLGVGIFSSKFIKEKEEVEKEKEKKKEDKKPSSIRDLKLITKSNEGILHKNPNFT